MSTTDPRPKSEPDEYVVRGYLVKINGRAWGVTLGVMFGLLLFVATNVLVLKGGPDMGTHLGLLSNYLPGYSVSFVGSIVGFLWAFAIGFVTGRFICVIYNRAARG